MRLLSDPHSGTEGGGRASLSWMLTAVKQKEETEKVSPYAAGHLTVSTALLTVSVKSCFLPQIKTTIVNIKCISLLTGNVN